ncbi:DinB family protein [bacterium]|nr:DinB family protein [bacterium]
MVNQNFSRAPQAGEYPPYFETYLALVDETDIFAVLESQIGELRGFLGDRPESMMDEVHEPYTWTIKQALGHVIDTERIFGYRACCIAANEEADLPGFDQDAYVANSSYSEVSAAELMDELDALRRGNLAMLKRMHPEYWDRSGRADGKAITVRTLAYLLVGHVRHHQRIFEQRLAV